MRGRLDQLQRATDDIEPDCPLSVGRLHEFSILEPGLDPTPISVAESGQANDLGCAGGANGPAPPPCPPEVPPRCGRRNHGRAGPFSLPSEQKSPRRLRNASDKDVALGRINPLTAAGLLAIGLHGLPASAQTTPAAGAALDPAAFVQKWDRSGKGLLDMKGVLNAAIVKFEMLDKDHKGRLTKQDLAPTVTVQDFAAANPDGDTTIGAEEWFDLVRRHFHAANPDNDGSLSADELKTSAGQALLRLV